MSTCRRRNQSYQVW